MNSFKHVYYHDNSFLCEEWVKDDMSYKIQLEISKTFYCNENGEWSIDYNGKVDRRLNVKMKMWKMDGDTIYYKSYDVVYDSYREDEW